MSLTEHPVALDNTTWEGGRLVADLLDPDLYRRNRGFILKGSTQGTK